MTVFENKSFRLFNSAFVFSALSAAFLVGCGKQEAPKAEAPPPAVTVYSVGEKPIGDYREFVARTVPAKEVDLIARVEGELIERDFDEGSKVTEGQVLLKIDPAAYQASLESAKADLTSRIAVAEAAKRDLTRGREIASDGYISQSDLDKLISNDSQAKAAVKVAKASLEKAELNLGYTQIEAPFAGRIGIVNYSVGNVVGPTSGTLATLTSMNPMYVSFQVEESDFVSYLQNSKERFGKREDDKNRDDIDISLKLPNDTTYEEKGKLIFADTKIEEGMGTVELRAEFSNPEGVIVPGLFVTLLIENKDKKPMVLVPQAAVQENMQGKFVLVVDENNVVSQQLVTLGRRINAMWVVESGLPNNSRVIIEGLQKVRPGSKVQPYEKQVNAETGVITDLVTQ